MAQMKYPHIEVVGGPGERGRQYGTQAADRVRRSIDAYRSIFEDLGRDWDDVLATARQFEPSVRGYDERYLEEMRGIADGAGVPYEHVLAINIRTEIISPATAGEAGVGAECSAVAILPEATASGHTLIAQNWDNLPHTAETVVVLEARQDDGPNFVTVVEAGLLAKSGFNSAGIGVTTNALITDDDVGDPEGVPLHVILRGILDSTSLAEAVGAIRDHKRASSSNYLIAHADGTAIDVEATPGLVTSSYVLEPQDGVLLHTNHFTSPEFDGEDVLVVTAPDSLSRLDQLGGRMRGKEGHLDVDDIKGALTDHEHFPKSLCCHPDPNAVRPSARSTASVIMDLDTYRLWLAEGNPCEVGYHEFDYSELMASGSMQAAHT